MKTQKLQIQKQIQKETGKSETKMEPQCCGGSDANSKEQLEAEEATKKQKEEEVNMQIKYRSHHFELQNHKITQI